MKDCRSRISFRQVRKRWKSKDNNRSVLRFRISKRPNILKARIRVKCQLSAPNKTPLKSYNARDNKSKLGNGTTGFRTILETSKKRQEHKGYSVTKKMTVESEMMIIKLKGPKNWCNNLRIIFRTPIYNLILRSLLYSRDEMPNWEQIKLFLILLNRQRKTSRWASTDKSRISSTKSTGKSSRLKRKLVVIKELAIMLLGCRFLNLLKSLIKHHRTSQKTTRGFQWDSYP